MSVILPMMAILRKSVIPPTIDDPIVHWKFDESSGALVADSVGSKNGTALGGMSRVTGQVGANAGSFDGVDDVVTVPDNSIFTPSALSISVWIKPDDLTSAYQAIVSHYADGSSSDPSWRLMLRGPNNTLEIIVLEDGSNYLTAVAPTSTISNNWHHVVGVWDGGLTSTAVNVWVDGVKETTVQNEVGNFTSLRNSAQLVRIGGSFGNGVAREFFDGAIDDVLVYDRALTQEQITYLYNSTK